MDNINSLVPASFQHAGARNGIEYIRDRCRPEKADEKAELQVQIRDQRGVRRYCGEKEEEGNSWIEIILKMKNEKSDECISGKWA